jgi:hypothetical protein
MARSYRETPCHAVREQGLGVPLGPTKSNDSRIGLGFGLGFGFGFGFGFTEDFQRNVRALRTPRSGGLVEAEFQGLSDMDVARATMGQGWPVVACP